MSRVDPTRPVSRHPLVRAAWWAAAGVRSLRTAAQTAVGLIGVDLIGITEVPWEGVASASALAAVVSLLTSLAGLPEVDDESRV